MVDVESVSLSNILFITVLFFVIVLLWCRRRTDKRLPPGPISWSAFGHILQSILQGNRPLFEISLEWREKYGNLFLMKLGDVRVVWVCGLELAREVLIRRGPKFDSRPNWMPLVKETRQNEGILFNSGETYKQLKSMVQKVGLGAGLGDKSLETRILEEVSVFTEELETFAGSGKEVQLDSLVRTSFMNLLHGIIFGQRFENCGHSDKFSTWIQLLDEIQNSNRIFHMTDFIPCLSFLSLRKRKSLLTEKLKSLRKLLRQKTLQHNKTNSLHGPVNLIDLYLEAKKEGTDISENNLLCLILDCFTADTNADTFLWMLAFIVAHEDVQQNIRDEVAKVIRNNNCVTSSDMEHLSYTRATIYEVLRLRGNQLIYPHATFRDTKLGDNMIPKQSLLIVNLASIHLDPQLWDKPSEFCPQRFLDNSGKLKQIDHFYPYGMGNRMCSLQKTSERALFLFFANIIRQFKFMTSSEGETVDLAGEPELLSLTLKPKPLHVKIAKVA